MIVAATNNPGKLREIAEILPMKILSLKEAGIVSDPEETAFSIKENARIKAVTAKKLTPYPVLADDTGLFIKALDGAPGVRSARFAEVGHRRETTLELMKDKTDRRAYFETVICYVDENNDYHFFTGRVDGVITAENRGENGFGYDSIFEYNGKTFAEMTDEEKNEISHRKRALEMLKEYLAD